MAEKVDIIITASDRASKALGSINAKMKGLGGRAAGALKSVAKLGIGLGAIGTVAGLGMAVKGAVDFDKAMRNVNTIARQSEEGLSEMGDRILNMSKTFPQSATEIADGMYQIQSASFAGEDAFKVLDASMKAGTAGLSDTKTAADAITTVLNSYGMSADNAGAVSDLMFKTVEKGKTTFPELASALSKVTSTASAAGVPFEEVSAAFATMTKQGLTTDEAGVALNQTMLQLLKPSEALSEGLEEMGYASGSALLAQEGLSGAMEALSGHFGSNIDSMVELFPNIRALKGALTLTGEGARVFAGDLGAMANASGAASAAFEEQSKSTSVQWQLLKNNLNAVLIELGQRLLPVINSVIQRLIPFVQNLMNVGSRMKEMGKNSAIINQIKKSFDSLADTFKVKVLPFLQQMIGFFITQLPTIKEAFQHIISIITQAGNIIMTAWAAIWARIGEPVMTAMSFILNVVSGALGTLKDGLAVIMELVQGNWDGVHKKMVEASQNFWERVGAITKKFGAKFKNAWRLLGFAVKTIVVSWLNFLISVVEMALNRIIDKLNSAISSWVNRINTLIKAAFRAVGKQAEEGDLLHFEEFGKVDIPRLDMPVKPKLEETESFKKEAEKAFEEVVEPTAKEAFDFVFPDPPELKDMGNIIGEGIGDSLPVPEAPEIAPVVDQPIQQIINPKFENNIYPQTIDDSNIEIIAEKLNNLMLDKLAKKTGTYFGGV
jgi:TP901 family phage tail tape measure protein